MVGVIMTENLGRCPRCHRFLIGEEFSHHQCEITCNAVKEIVLDWITDRVEDHNRDTVLVGTGLDGIYYRLVVCKHNPPHSTKWKFTGQPPDKATVYPPGGGPPLTGGTKWPQDSTGMGASNPSYRLNFFWRNNPR